MPALPNVPKVLKLAFRWGDTLNLDIVSRLYISYSGTAPATSDLTTMAGVIAGTWTTNMAPMQHTVFTLSDILITDLTSPSAASVDTPVSVAGTRSGSDLPVSTAAVIAYEFARRYRGGHSRGYWPLGVETDLATDRAWNTSFITDLTTAFTNFMTGIGESVWGSGGTLAHVNVSYFHGFTVITSPTTGRARNLPTLRGTPLVDPITGSLVRPVLGTQRRRLQNS